MLLTVSTLSKAYGDYQVLNGVTFTLNAGQKIGLVGANGVGKSTLLKIIVGEVEPDGGGIQVADGADLGYLAQALASAEGQTIEAFVDQMLGNLRQIEDRLRTLEAAMARPNGTLDALLAEYGALSDEFERRNGYALEHETEAVFAGLGIAHLSRQRAMTTLSGGEKALVGLAALLLQAPDLLLLDEPTNHLDFAALTWLAGYLQSYRGGLLVVSHDRHFLNQTVGAIVEIEEHSKEAKQYSGNYDFYAQMKKQERIRWVERYWAQQEEIWELRKLIKSKVQQNPFARAARDNDKFAYTFKTEKLQSSIARNLRNAEERLRRIEQEPIPKPPSELVINPEFDPQAIVSKTPITVAGVWKSYGDHPVLKDVYCTVDPASRIVLIGPNGAGKSTLLKIMAGVEQPDVGEVFSAASVVVGYLDQEQETLADGLTLFDAYRQGRSGDWEELKAELLQYGLFTWPDLLKPVATLSVGQKRKLQLARLIAQRANLLLLDEPTNHISLDVLEEFEAALQRFSGPIVAISHDRRFIERFATEIWTMEDGRLTRHLGGWERYQESNKTTKAIIREEFVPNPIESSGNFIIRPPVVADIPAIVDVLNADWIDIQGAPDSTVEGYRREWDEPGLEPAADRRVATTVDGTVVAAIHASSRKPHVRNWIWGAVHPSYRGRGLGTRLTTWAEGRVRERIPEAPPEARVAVGSAVSNTHRLGAELLRNLGFAHNRSFYTMKIEMAEPPPPPIWPAGITVQGMRPDQEEAVYRAMKEAFRDHWGHVDSLFEEDFPLWQHFIHNYPGYEPGLFFLAMAGEEIAGIANCFAKDNEFPDMAWVDDLAVRRPWRRQGVALALLHHAFGEFYGREIKKVGLGVDASSLTGATHLYEKAGMHVFRQFDSYEKELRSGKDLTTQSLD